MTTMEKVLAVVMKEVGVHEFPGPKDNARILEYHAATRLHSKTETTPWCAAFASWALQEGGAPSLHTAWARDYLMFGHRLSVPTPGCILVFERGDAGGSAHVTFFHHAASGLVFCAGGNQHDSVSIQGYGRSKLIGVRGY